VLLLLVGSGCLSLCFGLFGCGGCRCLRLLSMFHPRHLRIVVVSGVGCSVVIGGVRLVLLVGCVWVEVGMVGTRVCGCGK
jgi:hypothetical protein